MKRAIAVALGIGVVISSAAAIGIGAALTSAPQTMSRPEYVAALAGIEAARPQVIARCEALPAAARELCRVEAGADELVRVADLEASFRRTQDAARGAQRARIEARYQVERTKCAALAGLKKDQCLIAAHALRGRTLLEVAAPYEERSRG